MTIAQKAQFAIRPLYLQVRDLLIRRIARGEWRGGQVIPNEIDLARELGVSPGTVRKALDGMEADRLVVRRQGRGTFVCDPASEDMLFRHERMRDADGQPLQDDLAVIDAGAGEATELECERLSLDPGENVLRLRRLRQWRGRPYMVEDATLPVSLFGQLTPEDLKAGAVTPAPQQGVLLDRAIERVSLGGASAMVAEALGLSEGDPVLKLDRVVYSIDGVPAVWRLGLCHTADLYYVAEMQ